MYFCPSIEYLEARGKMDRIDIELFLAIVKWKSITRVSEIKHFSQPTVSYRLKALEKELGVRPFYRQQGLHASIHL